MQTAKSTLLEGVRARFDGVQSGALYAIATMLDANFKDHYFDTEKKEGARKLLLNSVYEMASGVKDGGEHGGVSTGNPYPKARTGTLLDMYDEIIEENVFPQLSSTSETTSQVSKNNISI